MGLREILLVSGGLGLFLYGMRMMSSGLEVVAGDRMQFILRKATSNRFFGVIVGILATIVINSSTATTIMTVSFVNSGMMNLTQAIGIIMGANVGTTFSAQLIAFRLDTFAPFFIFVGAITYLFFKKASVKNTGFIILGFGVLFFGVSVMGGPFKDLAQQPGFNAFLTAFSNPFMALLAGFVFTAIIQSSSATTGLLVTLHLSGVPIPFETSAFIILGTNIGTSITTVIASIPANRESKRAALFHIMYDVIGSAVFGTLIYVFPGILVWFTETWAGPARQVAMFHTLYNFATMFLLLPFVSYIARLMERIVPIKADAPDGTYERKLLYLGTPMVGSSADALITANNAKLETVRMGRIANESFRLSTEAFFENDADKAKQSRGYVKTIEYLKRKIKAKLIEANSHAATTQDDERIQKMLTVLLEMGKVGECAEKMVRTKNRMNENGIIFSETELNELKMLSDVCNGVVNEALAAYENDDDSKLPMLKSQRKIIKSIKSACVENHMERFKGGNLKPESLAAFSDMIKRLEKGAEHAKDIAALI
ncbi:MAG: Na/Pi cotransporter family protein [Defluviitaleaceae bacterium]|nr:Na/Pi cotransporter family protein [Defluviitaleaceae bacterium]